MFLHICSFLCPLQGMLLVYWVCVVWSFVFSSHINHSVSFSFRCDSAGRVFSQSFQFQGGACLAQPGQLHIIGYAHKMMFIQIFQGERDTLFG